MSDEKEYTIPGLDEYICQGEFLQPYPVKCYGLQDTLPA